MVERLSSNCASTYAYCFVLSVAATFLSGSPRAALATVSLYHECGEGMNVDKKRYINPKHSYYYKCAAMSLHLRVAVAQLVENSPSDARVGGLIPAPRARHFTSVQSANRSWKNTLYLRLLHIPMAESSLSLFAAF